MKKINIENYTLYFEDYWKKSFRILTLAIFLSMALFPNASASNTYSQNVLLNLHLKNTTLEAALQAIENQSEFFFVYSSKIIDIKQKLDIDITNSKIDNVLDKILGNSNIKYVINNRQIMLMLEKSEASVIQQQNSISGKVTDNNGSPIPGVSVVVKGTTLGTTTDIEGKYSIVLPQRAIALTFSFIGMIAQEITIGTKTQINIVMEETSIALDEVVAVGYGTQKKSNLTGAIASVKSGELVKSPLASVSQTLAGRLPGLISKQSQGAPGQDDAVLSIRGFGAPLVIIDGVEGNFAKLNPNEIETVTILKDASAAIYGARAGNGVILVNTKRGTLGKPVINFNTSYTGQSNTRFLKPTSSGQFAELANEFWQQRGAAGSAPYTKSDIDKFYAGTDPDFPNTDWYSAVARKSSPMKEYNLSVSGGNDRVKYYTFIGMLDQQSFFKSNDGNFKRYNVRANIDAKVTDNLTASIDLSSSMGMRKFPIRGGSENGAFFSDLWSQLPIYPAFLPDPDKYSYSGSVTQVVAETQRKGNGYRDNNNTNIKGSMALVYTVPFVKGLSLKAFGNYSKDFNFEKLYNRKYPTYKYNNASKEYIFQALLDQSRLVHTDFQNQELTGQFSLNFERTFADHYISALAIYEVIDYSSNTVTANRGEFINSDFDYLFGGSELGMGNNGYATEMGRASYIGRLNYSYKNRYLIDATLRHDASAKFPSDSRWGTFPSVSLGWRLSEEGFIKNSMPGINTLKLRGGFSKTGNDAIGNFQYLSGYTFGPGMPFGGATQIALASKGLANPLLSWEKLTIYNLGLDFGMLNDKLYGSFDVFTRKREGIAGTRSSSLPNTFGDAAPLENLNSITSKGFEVLVGTRNVVGQVKLDISANLSYSRAKWDYYDEPVYLDKDNIRLDKNTGNYVDRTIGYLSDGLFTTQAEIDKLGYDQDGSKNSTLKPGDLKFKDLNKDGKIDWKDRDVIGNGGTPHWMFGTNINASYKNFDLSMLFQGAWGYSVYNNLNGSISTSTFGATSTALWENRWTEANNDRYAAVPRIGSNSATRSYYTDYFLKDGAYLRLKVLSVGYTLPQDWMKTLRLGSVRVYFAATNLLTFDKLKKYGIDPETTTAASNSNDIPETIITSVYNITPQARNGTAYPQQKTLSLGLNITF